MGDVIQGNFGEKKKVVDRVKNETSSEEGSRLKDLRNALGDMPEEEKSNFYDYLIQKYGNLEDYNKETRYEVYNVGDMVILGSSEIASVAGGGKKVPAEGMMGIIVQEIHNVGKAPKGSKAPTTTYFQIYCVDMKCCFYAEARLLKSMPVNITSWDEVIMHLSYKVVPMVFVVGPAKGEDLNCLKNLQSISMVVSGGSLGDLWGIDMSAYRGDDSCDCDADDFCDVFDETDEGNFDEVREKREKSEKDKSDK